MSTFKPHLIHLDTDQSLFKQPNVLEQMTVTEPLVDIQQHLRLWANHRSWRTVRSRIKALRSQFPDPWFTFMGSGDFHHLTLALLQTLAPDIEPFTLVLIDNHPDWFCHQPVYHCGNWVSGVLQLPFIKKIILVAQDSDDLKGFQFNASPWKALCDGRVELYPYARESSLVPLKWPLEVKGVRQSEHTFLGTRLHFQTIAEVGEENFFQTLSHKLAGERIYVSIDKDSLRSDTAVTDWEQGRLSQNGLLTALSAFIKQCSIVGMDICGETAPVPLKSLTKRLDAARLLQNKIPLEGAHFLNQQLNLAILHTIAKSSIREEVLQ